MGLFKSKEERKLERDMEIRKGIQEMKRNVRGLEKHGIFRDIPDLYALSDDSDRARSTEVVIRGVTDARGTTLMYSQSQVGSYWRIRIGDPNVTVSGPQTYAVDYTEPQRSVAEDGTTYLPPLRSAPDAPAASWDAAAYKANPAPPPAPSEPVTAVAEATPAQPAATTPAAPKAKKAKVARSAKKPSRGPAAPAP